MRLKLFAAAAVIILIGFYLFAQKTQAPTTDSEIIVTDTPNEEVAENNQSGVSTEEEPAETTENQTVAEQPQTTPTPAPYTPPAPEPQSEPVSSLPFYATVTYDGDEFTPSEITIIEGGTVRFVNIGDVPMWVASDNHPTHTRYPIKDEETDCIGSSFDQCESVELGGSWSFAFTRIGTFGYHNHMRAKDTGEVTVMSREEYEKKN